MSSVDDRAVNMKFNNSNFEQGVKTTMSTLDKLKQSLNFSQPKNSLNELSNSASKFNLGNMGNAVDGVSKKFLALATIGITALANIANRAVNAGITMIKSLTVAPITAGLHEYETQLGSIQTILANTGLSGPSGLGKVNAALQELNTYSDKTIYNFTQMARNIGTFTAAGVKLEPATAAIKGIANLAALSGSNADQASTAMYQLSQAMASGSVKLMDWNSVVNAGMGGKVFQTALFNTAKQMKTISGVPMNMTFEQWTKAGNSFRDSLQKGWITTDVLTQTLSQFTGDLTDAQLKAMGYNAQQIAQIQKQAQVAQDAATKVKTFSQLMDTLREAVGSGWAQTWQTVIGNFDEAKKLWTDVNNVVGGFITKSAQARNKVLGDWKALGGRTAMIEGIKNAFQALVLVVQPIKTAFREIFPAKTGKDLYQFTLAFKNFMASLKMGPESANNLRRTFRGLFAILDIGKQIITGVFRVITSLLGVIGTGSSGLLDFTGNIGDMIVRFDDAIKKGGILKKFFDNLGVILAAPLNFLFAIRDAIFSLFNGFNKKDSDAMSAGLGRVSQRLDTLSTAATKITNFFTKLRKKVQPAIDAIKDAFASFGDAVANAFKTGNFSGIVDALNTGLLGVIALTIRKFFKKGVSVDFGGGMLGSIKESFNALTGTMKAMQAQVKADMLLKIAMAIGLLTLSVVALSLIDSRKLQSALLAMAVGFGELLGAMAILTKISGTAGFVKVPVIAASLDLLAGAILILTVALMALSLLSWEKLLKGLTGIGALLGMISAASIPLSKSSASMISAGIGITAIAVAMNILYFAVKNFSKLDWSELGKGLAGVAGALAAINIGVLFMPSGMIATGVGLVAISVALNVIYLAVKNFSKLNWKEMGKGLAGVGGSLLAIALGMQLMPPGLFLQAAGLIGVSVALQLIAKAVKNMSKLSWKEMGKGLAVLASSLVVLAGGLYLMTGAIPGAIALTIVAVGLNALVPVLQNLGKLSWKEIVHGLVAMAGAFTVVGLAGLILGPVTPAIAALGAALLLIGGGLALAGVGALAFSVAMTALAASGAAGIKVLLEALKGFINLLPMLGTNLALGLTNFIVEIGKQAPKIIGGITSLLSEILTSVVKLAPKMAVAFSAVMQSMLTEIRKNFPLIVETGFQLLLQFLQGISSHIEEVTTRVAEITVKFLNSLAARMPSIVAAGTNLLVKFLQGIASNIGRVVTAATDVVVNFVKGIANNVGRIITAGGNLMVKFVEGIGSSARRVVTAGTNAVIKFIEGVGSNAVRLANAAADVIIKFINGLANAIESHVDELRAAGLHLAGAIIDGLTLGLLHGKDKVVNTMMGIATTMFTGPLGYFLVKSPSKRMIEFGENIIAGWAIGLNNKSDDVVNASTNVANRSLTAMKKSMSNISKVMAYEVPTNPIVSPVLDLTSFRKDANNLRNLINVPPVVIATSYSQAVDISSRQRTLETPYTQEIAPGVGPSFKFEQNNYSPEALSTIDIYRQTKNQLAQAKKVLGVVG